MTINKIPTNNSGTRLMNKLYPNPLVIISIFPTNSSSSIPLFIIIKALETSRSSLSLDQSLVTRLEKYIKQS